MDEQAEVEWRDAQAVFGVLHFLDAEDGANEVGERAHRPPLEAGRRYGVLGRRRDRQSRQVAVEAGESVTAAFGDHLGAGAGDTVAEGGERRASPGPSALSEQSP